MKDAERFLMLLNERVPPASPRRHGLLLDDDGRLTLYLNASDPVHFDEADLSKPPEQLVEEIVQLLATQEAT